MLAACARLDAATSFSFPQVCCLTAHPCCCCCCCCNAKLFSADFDVLLLSSLCCLRLLPMQLAASWAYIASHIVSTCSRHDGKSCIGWYEHASIPNISASISSADIGALYGFEHMPEGFASCAVDKIGPFHRLGSTCTVILRHYATHGHAHSHARSKPQATSARNFEQAGLTLTSRLYAP